VPPNFTTTLKTFARRALWLLVPLAALYAAWFAYAHWRLTTQLARYKAAGEPVTMHDLVPPPIPDAVNGYRVLVDILATPLTPTEDNFINGMTTGIAPSLPLSPADMTLMESVLTTQAASLAAAERGHSVPKFAAPFNADNPFGSDMLAGMGRTRGAANIFSVMAMYHAQRGDSVPALRMTDHTRMLAAWTSQRHTLLAHLVTIAIYQKHADDLVHLAPEFHLRSATHPLGIQRQQLEPVIKELLDDAPLNAALVRSLQTERPYALYVSRRHIPGSFMRPMANLLAARYNDGTDELLAAVKADERSYSSSHGTLLSFEAQSNAELLVNGPFSGTNSYGVAYGMHLRALTVRHLAAAGLAVRLYQLDHGQLPPTLNALVPQYLPAVPVDLSSAARGPIRYDATQRIVYSINLNNTDDGGRLPKTYGTNPRDSVPPGNDDMVYPLYRVTSPASSAPSAPATLPTTPPPPESAPAE